MDCESSPSSSSGQIWKYDVFLSFSPEDTSSDFTSHLYFSLLRNEVKTLVHEDKKQEYNSSKILKEIEKSRISIVVFSRNYAASTNRLEELSKIAECIDSVKQKQSVFAVFYDLNPCEVRQQHKGVYEEVFGEYEERFKQNLQMVQRWRNAITKVANLECAWVVRKEINPLMTLITYDVKSRRPKNKMGIDDEEASNDMDECANVIECLRASHNLYTSSDDSYQVISNCHEVERPRKRVEIAPKLHSGRRVIKDNGITTQVINDIVRSAKNILGIKASSAIDEFELVGIQPKLEALEKLVDLGNSHDVIRVIGICGMHGSGKTTLASLLYHRISHKFDAFCFLHNVSTLSASCLQQQLLRQTLQEENLKISDVQQGSSLIATRLRNLKILLVLDDVHRIKILKELVGNRDWFGVGSRIIIATTNEHILRRYGVDQIYKVEPLKLEQIVQLWESHLLSVLEKEIFLDIACLFVGKDIHNVIEILSDCKFDHPTRDIEALIRNSVITISHDQKIEMHYMLQELGQKTVQREYPNEPGKRSRLWFDEDFLQVMETNTGTRKIKALVLNPEVLEETPLRVDGLSKMDGLQLLIIRNVNFSGDLKGLSKRLRYLSWHRFPFTCLPSGYEPYKLVQLIMPESNITQLWKESKKLPNLRNLDLHGSKKLKKTPHYERLPNLEKLNLEGCIGLVVLHPSITFLKKLKLLNLRNCTSLVNVPNNLFNLTSLEVLNVAGCSKFAECLDFDNWTSSTEGDEEVLSNQDLLLSEEIGKKLLACGIKRKHADSDMNVGVCANLEEDRKSKKEAISSQMEDGPKAWVSPEIKAETHLAMAENTSSVRIEATSSTISVDDEYPIAKCIVVLDEIDDVSDNSYMKALEKFKDPYWRQVFLTMSDKRKKAWLNNLV